MVVVLRTILELVHMKIFQVLFAFESFLSRPAFTNLLKQHIPFGLVAMAARRFGAIVTERKIWKGPALQVPLSRLAVRSADFCSVLFQQSANGGMTIHRLEHLQAGAVQSHNRKVVVERSKPPFIRMMLVGDQIGNMPGQEIEGVSRKKTRLVNSNSRFHCDQFS